MEANGTNLILSGRVTYTTDLKMLSPGDYEIECATLRETVESRRKARVKGRGVDVRRKLSEHWHRHYDEPDAPCDLSDLL